MRQAVVSCDINFIKNLSQALFLRELRPDLKSPIRVSARYAWRIKLGYHLISTWINCQIVQRLLVAWRQISFLFQFASLGKIFQHPCQKGLLCMGHSKMERMLCVGNFIFDIGFLSKRDPATGATLEHVELIVIMCFVNFESMPNFMPRLLHAVGTRCTNGALHGALFSCSRFRHHPHFE